MSDRPNAGPADGPDLTERDGAWAAPGSGPADQGPPGHGPPADGPTGHGSPPPGQPGFGTPGYGTPGYGTPGYAGFGTPGFGSPGFGTPGFGSPGYGPPPPGYGPPAHGASFPPPGGGGGYAPKPGVVPLRPLGVGEILDGAVSYIRRNPGATLGLSAVVAVVTQGLAVVLQLLLFRSVADVEASADVATAFGLAVGGGAIGLATAVISLLGTAVLTGMLVTVLGEAVLGRTLTWGAAWARARSRVLGLIGQTLLVGLAVGGVVLLAVTPGIITLVSGAEGVGVALIVLGVLAGGAVAIWIGVSWTLAAPAYVLESLGVVEALRRSWRLVRGQWWRVFGILLLGGLIATVIASILAVPFSVGGALLGGGDPLNPLPLVLGGIGGVIAATLTTPFSAGISGLLYVDQRIRREAFDLDLGRAAALRP